ncbi:CLUMA_CG003625, isoform A [Clunio marinus]|uniref:CLUMA_CG003625, isoform A n=1 Tax=Clunio marinus TaxID=568069 RepID=A0A1J1HPB6_9DIPT|nr:CLUMA_CG003625, isoform A [Clunio marinus]
MVVVDVIVSFLISKHFAIRCHRIIDKNVWHAVTTSIFLFWSCVTTHFTLGTRQYQMFEQSLLQTNDFFSDETKRTDCSFP